jgi:serine/threonine-protein kinase HipA
MNGEAVGTWSWLATGQELKYAESWLNSPRGRPLSLSLPFQPGNKPLGEPAVRFWFENLLPDSKTIRERLSRQFNVGSMTAFDLLAEVGRDCVGALQIVPEGDDPGEIRAIRGEALSDAEVAEELVAALSGRDGLGSRQHRGSLRLSIAGAQEKTALLWHRDRWLRPLGATPTTHILKLPLGLVGNLQLDLRHSVENEWLCARIVAAYGSSIARCEMASFGEFKVLVVERFDRAYSPDGSWILRLPQEDLCQATGASADLKYEADGGPGIDRILGLLATSSGRRDPIDFLKSQILFWMLCAPDGHAKNFSIALEAGGAYRLTPLYDVMSAYPLLGKGPSRISAHQVKLAMAVRSSNPHWRMKEILPRHWSAVAKRNGLGPIAGELMEELAEATPRVIDTVAAGLPADFPPSVAEPIFRGLELAARKLAAG